jgi:hypothetical protein
MRHNQPRPTAFNRDQQYFGPHYYGMIGRDAEYYLKDLSLKSYHGALPGPVKCTGRSRSGRLSLSLHVNGEAAVLVETRPRRNTASPGILYRRSSRSPGSEPCLMAAAAIYGLRPRAS